MMSKCSSADSTLPFHEYTDVMLGKILTQAAKRPSISSRAIFSAVSLSGQVQNVTISSVIGGCFRGKTALTRFMLGNAANKPYIVPTTVNEREI